MKLFIFFGLIGVSFLSSLLLGKKSIKNNQRLILGIGKAIFINFIILGFGTIWWFATETDGISQGIGGMIYLISSIVIAFVDIVVLVTLSRKIGK